MIEVTQGRVLYANYMTVVSPTVPSPGDEANATDISVPINQLATVINGGLDDSNISGISGSKIAGGTIGAAQITDGSITTAKLSTAAGEVVGAWQSWSPTWTNLTVGNGTLAAYYHQTGKTVHFNLVFTAGSTSTVGIVKLSLPVTPSTHYPNGSVDGAYIGMAHYLDSGVSIVSGSGRLTASNTIDLIVYGSAANFVNQPSSVTNTIPHTWGTGDRIFYTGTYEAA